MAKIEFNSYDLQIKTLEDGTEVVQINPRLAFNEEFISAMKENGVSKWIERREEKEEVDETPLL